MSKTSSSGTGIGSTGSILFIIFLVLKLTGVIDWSWFWVTAPLWISIIAVLAIVLIIGVIAMLSK